MPRKVKKYAPDEPRPKGRRADGRLSTKIKVGVDTEGKPVYKYVYGYTKAELQDRVDEVRCSYTGTGQTIQRDILFGTFAVQCFDNYIKPTIPSVAGRDDYENALNNHILPIFGSRQIRAITPFELQAFINSKAHYSESTLTKITTTLRRFFKIALAHGIIDRDPTLTLQLPISQYKKMPRRALTKQERMAAVHVGKNHDDGLFLLVLYCTGVRRGEALGIQGKDIDLANDVLTIQRDINFKLRGSQDQVDTLKTEAAYRTIPIVPLLHDALQKQTCFGEEFLFRGKKSGDCLSESSYQRLWDRLMAALYEYDPTVESRPIHIKEPPKPERKGKPGPKPQGPKQRSILTPHYFRHNYATMLYDQGVDILTAMKWFGHSEMEMLMGVYTHLSEEKEEENVDKIVTAFEPM